jgi:hypothetical protein
VFHIIIPVTAHPHALSHELEWQDQNFPKNMKIPIAMKTEAATLFRIFAGTH